jgi:competence protein ComEA
VNEEAASGVEPVEVVQSDVGVLQAVAGQAGGTFAESGYPQFAEGLSGWASGCLASGGMRFLDSGRMVATAPERLATMLGPVAMHPPESLPYAFGNGATSPAGHTPPAASLRSSPRPPDGDPPPGHLRSERLGEPGGSDGLPERWGALRRMLENRRVDPGLPGARALALAGIGAALVAGGYLWLSLPRPQPVPAPAGAASLAVPAGAGRRSPSAGPAVAASPPVVVHVAGRVRRPGIVTLPAGARVTDAIKAAGGVRPGTSTDALNLARKVADGEQILVGTPGSAAAQGVQAAPGSTGSAGSAPATPLDLNVATSEQMQQLPGVGPVLAQRIIDYRTQHGGFRTVEELRQVTGIGARRFAELKDLVRI